MTYTCHACQPIHEFEDVDTFRQHLNEQMDVLDRRQQAFIARTKEVRANPPATLEAAVEILKELKTEMHAIDEVILGLGMSVASLPAFRDRPLPIFAEIVNRVLKRTGPPRANLN